MKNKLDKIVFGLLILGSAISQAKMQQIPASQMNEYRRSALTHLETIWDSNCKIKGHLIVLAIKHSDKVSVDRSSNRTVVFERDWAGNGAQNFAFVRFHTLPDTNVVTSVDYEEYQRADIDLGKLSNPNVVDGAVKTQSFTCKKIK